MSERQTNENHTDWQERFLPALEQLTDIVLLMDEEGRIRYVSPTIEEISGFAPQEMTDRPFRDLVSANSESATVSILDDLVNKNRPVRNRRLELKCKDGSTFWTDFSCGRYGKNAKTATFVGTLVDITEQIRAEDRLRKSEEHFRLIFETSPESIILTRLEDGLIVDVNQSHTRITGFTRDEIIGKTVLETGIWHDASQRQKLVEQLRKTGHFTNWEVPFRTKDGDTGTVLASGKAILLGGEPHILAISRDITELKRVQEARRESEELFRLIFDTSPGGLLLCRLDDSKIVKVNESFIRLSGFPREELLGRSTIDVGLWEKPNDRQKLVDQLHETGMFTNEETRFRRKDGTLGTALLSGTLVNLHGTLHILSAIKDITDIIQEQEKRMQLQVRLQQAQKMEALGTLAGGIAHDFNNIIQAFVGFTALAKIKSEAGEGITHELDMMAGAARRAADLVQSILSFSRQNEPGHQLLELRDVVQEVVKLLRASIPTTIEIRHDISDSSGAVMADPTGMHQVLMNICANAAHAMRESGGILEVRLERIELDEASAAASPELVPGKYERISVTDTGHGMDAQTLARIFDPFFTTKEQGEGTGMGMSVVHGIVKSHGGAVTVYSEPGQGTTFHVYIPASEAAATGEPSSSQPVPLPTGTEHVLLVDDELSIVEFETDLLESLGYTVTARTSSPEALELLKENPHHFDLLITDQTMPHMTGLQLIEAAREIRPDLPVILSTGFSTATTPERLEDLGVDELMMKPTLAGQLASTVRDVLERKS